jgi:hypothetical protein
VLGRAPISSRNSAWVNARNAPMRSFRQAICAGDRSTTTTLAGSSVSIASALSPAEQIDTSVPPATSPNGPVRTSASSHNWA